MKVAGNPVSPSDAASRDTDDAPALVYRRPRSKSHPPRKSSAELRSLFLADAFGHLQSRSAPLIERGLLPRNLVVNVKGSIADLDALRGAVSRWVGLESDSEAVIFRNALSALLRRRALSETGCVESIHATLETLTRLGVIYDGTARLLQWNPLHLQAFAAASDQVHAWLRENEYDLPEELKAVPGAIEELFRALELARETDALASRSTV